MATTRKGYSALQIGLHWTVALLVVFQFLVHEGMERAYDAAASGAVAAPSDATLATLHIAGGTSILILALWRLWLRFTVGVPDLPREEPPALRLLAKATHTLIYCLLIGMPLGGALAWFAGVEIAAWAHALAGTVLLGAIALHVAGALFQHFFLRSSVLTRMVMTLD